MWDRASGSVRQHHLGRFVILSDPTFVGTNGSTAAGKQVPNIPRWRTTLGATYRPTKDWAFTVAGRYQSKIYATLDNTDIIPHVYQAFDPFFVVESGRCIR